MGGSAGYNEPCPYSKSWVTDPTMEATAGRRRGDILGRGLWGSSRWDRFGIFGSRTHLTLGLVALRQIDRTKEE